jgi:hypothetical protein
MSSLQKSGTSHYTATQEMRLEEQEVRGSVGFC